MLSKSKDTFVLTSVVLLLCLGVWQTLKPADPIPTPYQANLIQNQSTFYQSRIIELPADQGVWWTTAVFDSPTPTSQGSRQLSALLSTPRLQSLIAQTKYTKYTPNDLMYQQRFSRYYGNVTPQLIIQEPNGQVVYKATGDQIPADPDVLADDIQLAISNCRPKPTPTPSPAPVQPQPQPNSIPDISPNNTTPNNTTPHSSDTPFWLFLIPVVGAGYGFFSEIKKGSE